MNNCSWEMLRVFQPESRFNTLDDWQFAQLAAPLGGDGQRVTTRRELAGALERAAAQRGRFQLIEAMIPAGSVSPTLEGFVAALKRRTAATGDVAARPNHGRGGLDPAPARDA